MLIVWHSAYWCSIPGGGATNAGLASHDPPLCVGDLEDLEKDQRQPDIKMLGRKGEASQGGEKRPWEMVGGNYQLTCVVIYLLSPLTNMYHVGTPPG